MPETALGQFKIVDLSTHVAGPLCSKMFADYGSEVLKVEPAPAGDPARSSRPLLPRRPPPGEKPPVLLSELQQTRRHPERGDRRWSEAAAGPRQRRRRSAGEFSRRLSRFIGSWLRRLGEGESGIGRHVHNPLRPVRPLPGLRRKRPCLLRHERHDVLQRRPRPRAPQSTAIPRASTWAE